MPGRSDFMSGNLVKARARWLGVACWTWLIVAPLQYQSVGAEPMHVQMGRAVFRLEHEETISRPGQTTPEILQKSSGTAFVVEHEGRLYLVTARHVVEQGYDLRARVPTKRNDTGDTEVIELRIPRASWVFHELGPEERNEGQKGVKLRGVDVAVTPLHRIKDRAIVKFLSCRECPSGEKNQLATTDPAPPSTVLIAGFPGNIGFGLLEQRPMFRSGIIALVTGERSFVVNGAFADERTFLIDGKATAGNSGSPVFRISSGGILLIGLISATNQAADFAVAEPASRIRETLERARLSPPEVLPGWHLLPK